MKKKCGNASMWRLVEEVKEAILNPDEDLINIAKKQFDLFEHPLFIKCSKFNNNKHLKEMFYKVIAHVLKMQLNIDLEKQAVVVHYDTRIQKMVGKMQKVGEVDPSTLISSLKVKGTKIYHGNMRILFPLIAFLYFEEIQKGVMTIVEPNSMTHVLRFTLVELPKTDSIIDLDAGKKLM